MALCLSSVGMASEKSESKVTAETALGWLKNGNARFLRPTALRKDGQSKSDISRLSPSQTPHAIVLSCSDSRVPPEIVFDQKLGEIFVIRTAGEALDDNVIGSIEYAVEHLHVPLLVVMGHTSCGAVKAAIETLDGSRTKMSALDNLLGEIHPRLTKFKGRAPSSDVAEESWANTDGVAHDLLKRSKTLTKAWSEGNLWVVPALYDVKDGKVGFRDRLTAK